MRLAKSASLIVVVLYGTWILNPKNLIELFPIKGMVSLSITSWKSINLPVDPCMARVCMALADWFSSLTTAANALLSPDGVDTQLVNQPGGT